MKNQKLNPRGNMKTMSVAGHKFEERGSVVSFSGGLDSTCLLMHTVKQLGVKHVVALNFHYGSKHNDEERARATRIAYALDVRLIKVELPFIDNLFRSDLLKSGGKIPEGHYEAKSMKKTVVPYRNGIMLSIATGLAESIKMDSVRIANHAGDHAVYADCRRAFVEAQCQAMKLGTDRGIQLVAPFTDITKAQLLRSVSKFKGFEEIIEHTWSCYNPVVRDLGGAVHCSRCGTCIERIEAFKEASIEDPTVYADTKYAHRVLKRHANTR